MYIAEVDSVFRVGSASLWRGLGMAPALHFVKFSENPHEIEKMLVRRVHVDGWGSSLNPLIYIGYHLQEV